MADQLDMLQKAIGFKTLAATCKFALQVFIVIAMARLNGDEVCIISSSGEKTDIPILKDDVV